jgi:hypothetical protein
VHVAAHDEAVALAHRPQRVVAEVGLQVRVEEVAGDAVDGVLERGDLDARAGRDLVETLDVLE